MKKNRADTVRRHIEALRLAQQDNRDLVQGYTKERLVKGAQGTLRKIADDLRKAAATAEVQDAANDLDKLAIGWGLFLRFMPYPSITKSIELYEALLGDIKALKASLAEVQERETHRAAVRELAHPPAGPSGKTMLLIGGLVGKTIHQESRLETVLVVQSVRVGFNIWFDGTRRAFVPAPDGRFVGFNGTEGFFTTDVNLVCDDRATLDLQGYPAPSDTARAEAKRRGWSW